MYSAFRPAARRLLSVRPNASLLAAARSRSITTQSIAFRPAAITTPSLRMIQRRWNSDEADKKIAADKAEEEGIAEAAINSVKEGAATSTTTVSADELAASDPLEAEPRLDDGEAFKNPYSRPTAPRNTADVAPRETVYIGNLFFDITAQDLKTKMEQFGIVTECNIVHDARGLSKGFGYVTFENIESATSAIAEMNQQIYEGRRVIVQYSNARSSRKSADGRPKGKPSRTLYIGNLAFDLTDRELNDIFKSIRNVIEVRVAVDRQTGLPRGFAHADFLDVASAQAAAEVLAAQAPHGRRLRIDYSQRIAARSAAEEVKKDQGSDN